MAKGDIGFQVLNINLKSRDRKGEEAYTQIIQSLFKKKIFEKIASDRSAILRTQNKAVFGKYVVFYGSIGKFTTIDGADWLNMLNMEKEKFEIPAHFFPNIKETYYIFVPEFHRMAIVNSGQFSIKLAQKFMEKALLRVMKPYERTSVVIEQDIDQFKELLSATIIKKLEMEITYSNADLSEDAEKFMDDQLRKAKVGKLKMTVTPDSSDSIELKESEVLDGLTRLSGSNGYVKATFYTPGNRKKTINTKDHPLRLKTILEGDNLFKSVVNKMVEFFIKKRPNN